MRKTIWIIIACLFILAIILSDCNSAEAAVPTEKLIYEDNVNSEALDTVWTLLRGAGYTETATAAIMGNLIYESGLYPYRSEGFNLEASASVTAAYLSEPSKYLYGWHGYGLAGWTGSTNHQRHAEWCEENGYSIDDLEGQVLFLIDDYPFMAPNSYKRINCYGPEDIVSATEDFRQSYEKSHATDNAQWGRARYAKSVYMNYGDESNYDTVEAAPYNFEIYTKVNALNEKLGLKRS